MLLDIYLADVWVEVLQNRSCRNLSYVPHEIKIVDIYTNSRDTYTELEPCLYWQDMFKAGFKSKGEESHLKDP